MEPKYILCLTALLSAILVNHAVAQESQFSNAHQVNTTASELATITAKAQEGVASAQFDLGGIYRQGDGVPKDVAKAAVWFQKAAEQGFAAAAFDLGMMYRQGDGVPRDDVIAAKWFLKAAAQGDNSAQAELGAMYANGNGLSKDAVRGYAWSSLAAKQGNSMAQQNQLKVEQKLTKKQRAEGESLVDNWKKGDTLTDVR